MPATTQRSDRATPHILNHVGPLAVTAVLLALAFPKPGWGWLAHLALVPATVLAVGSGGGWRLAWTSYLIALAWWLVRISWLSMVTVGGYMALSAYLALYSPAAWLAVHRLRRSYPRLPLTLTLPMVWVSLELVRSHFPAGGFGWFSLAHSQAPFSPDHTASRLIQIADVLGEAGVSFLVAMTNGLIADVLTADRGGSSRSLFGNPKLIRAGLLWGVCLGGAWVYGWYRIAQAERVFQDSLRVAVVQTNVPQDNKNHPTTRQMLDDWARMLDLTRQAAARSPRPQLIVWPETMVPTGLNQEALEHYLANQSGLEFFHQQIEELARSLNCHILVGAHAYIGWQSITTPDDPRPFEVPAKRFNSVFLYNPASGIDPDRYDKIHRVPFGEYIPWVEYSPWLKQQFIRYLSPYEVDYTVQPGQNWTRFAFSWPSDSGNTQNPPRSLRFATPICFEDTIPYVTRKMIYNDGARKEADVLVNLTNDGWYPGTHQGYQHLQIAVLRCVENRVPMARSVNTGPSGFIDSAGRIGPVVEVDQRQQQVEGFVAHTVQTDPRSTLHGRVGRTPQVLLSILTAGLVVFPVFQGRLPRK